MTRDEFLDRVRKSVAEGNRAGGAAALVPRASIGYQGAGPDPVARFRDELTAAGGQVHRAGGDAAAVTIVVELLRQRGAHRVLVGTGSFLDKLALVDHLHTAGFEPIRASEASRDEMFAADAGVSGVDYFIAETGSIVLDSRPDQPRSLSLLPPVHIAIAHRGQLLPDLFDLFDGGAAPSASLSIITGPSKTGDIELKLVTGVHGPGEVHVVLVG